MQARYDYKVAGHNWRLTEVQAAIAIPQLERLPAANRRRSENAARLSAGLAGIPGLVPPTVMPGREHVWHQYTVRVAPEARLTRDQLKDELLRRGVESGVYYPRAIYDYDAYRANPRVDSEPMPVAEQVAREVLSLPVHPHLTGDDVDGVVAAVRDALGA
jgi:dTDP-4-amino-4,6-dideoxygalactose transaminase